MAGLNKNFINRTDVGLVWVPSLFPAGTQHEVEIGLYGVAASSTIRLWVNGRETGNITVAPLLSNTATNIITALTTLTGGTWTSIYTVGEVIRLRHSTTNFFHIRPAVKPTTGNLTVDVFKGGYRTYPLEGLVTKLTLTEDVEYTDVTPIMSADEDTELKKRVVTFSFSVYGATDRPELYYALYNGVSGTVFLYDNKNLETPYASFYALIEGVSRDYSSVLEVDIRGRRKGDWIKPPGSL